MSNWWGTRRATSKRLQFEVKAMQRAFGNTFHLELPQKGKYRGRICWVGSVEINLDTPANPRSHLLRIVHPRDYPASPPEAYCEVPKIKSKFHQFLDGELCLFQRRDGISHGWNPGRSTGATIVGWAIQWLYAYYTWKATGVWPGLEESVPKDFRRKNV